MTKPKKSTSARTGKSEQFLSREAVLKAWRKDPSGKKLAALLRRYGFAPRVSRRRQPVFHFTPLPALF